MANVTYKTVINNAIKGFNDIQNKLHNIGAGYGSSLSAIEAASTTNPLSIANILTSDAFRAASISTSLNSQSAITTTVKPYLYSDDSTKTSVAINSTATTGSFFLTIKKDAVTSNGSVTPKVTVGTSGYIKNGITGSAVAFTGSNITEKKIFLQAGVLGITNGSPTNATATPGISRADTNQLAKLSDTENSGVLTAAPTGKTIGTDYWAITPNIASTTNGSVSAATAKVNTEGYVKSGITSNASGTAVNVGVTAESGTSYYIARLSSGTLSITDKGSTNITVGDLNTTTSTYPLSTSLTGTFTASVGGYLPVSGTVSATDSSVTVGRIAAAVIGRDGTSANIVATTAGYVPASTTLYTMPNASGFGLSITDKDSAITPGSTMSSGYYPLSTSLTGSITATTPGYYSGSATSATDSTVTVGKIAAATFGGSNAEGNKTITTQSYSVGAGYTKARTLTVQDGSVTNAAALSTVLTDTADLSTSNEANDGTSPFVATQPSSGDYYTVTATASSTVSPGWVSTGGTNKTDTKYLPKAKISYNSSATGPANFITVTGAGYLNAGTLDSIVAIGGTAKTGTATQPSGTQSGASASISGTTVTLSKSVAPSVSAGWISSGTAGTITLSGTLTSEEKTATAAGNITPSSGKLLTKVIIPSAAFTYISGSNGENFISCSTAGWVGAGAIAPTSGTLDKVSYTVVPSLNSYNGSTYSNAISVVTAAPSSSANAAKLSFALSDFDAGYATAGSDLKYPDMYIPTATASTTVTKPSVTVSTSIGTPVGFSWASSATDYYVDIGSSGSGSNGTATTKVQLNDASTYSSSTSGLVPINTAGTDTSIGVTVSNPNSQRKYLTAAVSTTQGVTGTEATSVENLTLESTNNSGIKIQAKYTGVSRKGKITTAGIIPLNTICGDSSGSLNGAVNYVKDVTVPASKTLNSVTLTSGASGSRTYLSSLTVNSLTTVSSVSISGIIDTITHVSDGYINTLKLSNGYAGIKTLNMNSGSIKTAINTGTLSALGTSSTAGALTISNNTYGTVNVWNAGNDKGVQVVNHTVKVDGTTVTNSSGDLITTTPTVAVSASNGTPSSSTTITANTSSPANKGMAVNYNDNKLGGSSEAAAYVTITATGSGGASAPSASASYTNSSAGWLVAHTSASGGQSANGSAVSTTSSDTNYIPADTTSSITANGGSFTTSATITANTNAASNKGAARNYNDNKCGGSAEASYYVTVSATSSGSGSAGSDKSLSVKDKYMLNNVTVSSGTPSKGTSSGDTNYILANNTSSVSVSAGTLTSNAYITNNSTSPSNKGNAVVYDNSNCGGSSEAAAYVKVNATSSGSATAGTGGTISCKDSYMLNNVTYSGTSIGSASTANGDTAYILADTTSSTAPGAGSFTTSTTITANTTSPANKGVAVNYNDNKCGGSSEAAAYVTISATSNGSGSAGSNGTLSVKDKYMLNNVTITSPTPSKGTSSGDTNYILADTTSSIAPGAGSFTTSATITANTNAASNKGVARNYNDNKCGGSSEASYYVTVSATSSGSGSAGSDNTLSVKDKYMLNNVTITSPTPSKGTSSGDTNYILANNTSSVTVSAGSLTSNAYITNNTTSPSNKGNAVVYDNSNCGGSSEASAYVKVNATSSGSATAGTGGTISCKDSYMLNNVTYSGTSIGSATTANGDTAYIKANTTSSVSVSAGTLTSNAYITNVSTSPSNKGAAKIYDDNKCGGSSAASYYVTVSATSSGSATAGTGGTISCKDSYMLNDVTYSGTAINSATTANGDTAYIKASGTTTITANAAYISGSASAFGTNCTLNSTNNGIKIEVTGAASATAGANKTLSVKDLYMLNDVSVKSAAISATRLDGATYYIQDVTVGSNKSFGVTNNGGTVTYSSSANSASKLNIDNWRLSQDTSGNLTFTYIGV